MSRTVSASEVHKDFGTYHDRALREPIRVTKHGRETVYIVSAETYHALKQAQRNAIRSKDLTDAELATISGAEIAPEHRYCPDEFE